MELKGRGCWNEVAVHDHTCEVYRLQVAIVTMKMNLVVYDEEWRTSDDSPIALSAFL